MYKGFKMAVCDIDGTLITDNGKITSENRKAILKMQQKGYIFALCTGRNIKRAVPIAKKLGINVPIVCIDGILLYDLKSQKPIFAKSMKKSTVESIIDIGKKYEIFTEVSNGYNYCKILPDDESKTLDFYHRHDIYGRVKNYFAGIRYFKTYEELKNTSGDIYQVVLATKSKDMSIIKAEISKINDKSIEIRDNLWDGYMFINSIGAGKAKGVKALCDMYGISLNETISFGDDNNDIDMLLLCEKGIAVENANERVKRNADVIVSSNNNSGVAEGLKMYFDI
ncbi:MAG: HAD family hydrolase [Clostridia bacterium]|nr:HAD family hydrolase [Clostridia bacterium]